MHEIAVVMTCFNRKENTLRCLGQLFRIFPDVSVYLVDDASTDGTAVAVKKYYPQVNLISSDGDLFWNRGMHLAWEKASMNNHRFYLWLNDDVVLRGHCISELLECSRASGDSAVISGIVDSHDGIEILYGGTDDNKILLAPTGSMQNIVNMNGNVVLVPRGVFSVLGNLDLTFHHDLGDVDYGLRARAAKILVLTTKSVIGSCDKNDVCRVRLAKSHISGRFKKLYSPLGSNPRINFYFRKNHHGFLNASIYYLYLHIINIVPDSICRILFGKRYFKDN